MLGGLLGAKVADVSLGRAGVRTKNFSPIPLWAYQGELDSTCDRFQASTRPFPVQRDAEYNWCGGGGRLVGLNKLAASHPCPVNCRPELIKEFIHSSFFIGNFRNLA